MTKQKGEYRMRRKLNSIVGYALSQLNQEIAKRTDYGNRTQKSRLVGSILYWSNAQRRWYRKEGRVKGYVKLGANEVFVSGHTVKAIDTAIPHLDELPLYKNSFEATHPPLTSSGRVKFLE